jgi:IS1 family transposase
MAEKFRKTVKRHETEHTTGDYRKPYERIIPKEKHVQTKCCSKTLEMLKLSFLLPIFLLKWNVMYA